MEANLRHSSEERRAIGSKAENSTNDGLGTPQHDLPNSQKWSFVADAVKVLAASKNVKRPGRDEWSRSQVVLQR